MELNQLLSFDDVNSHNFESIARRFALIKHEAHFCDQGGSRKQTGRIARRQASSRGTLISKTSTYRGLRAQQGSNYNTLSR